MVATGMSQQQVGDALGISQPAVSQQFRYAPDLEVVRPEELLDAAAPVLKALAAEYGYRRLAVFGSVARGEARQDSDIDLLVDAPPGTSSFRLTCWLGRSTVYRAEERERTRNVMGVGTPAG